MPVSTGMGRRLALIAVAAMTAALFPAAAAGERYEAAFGVGSQCTADTLLSNRTLLAAGGTGTALAPIVPRGGASVITRWEVSWESEQREHPQALEVYEALGQSGEYRKVAESETEVVRSAPWSNSFETRIPVDGGELVGLSSSLGTLACTAEPGAISLRADGTARVGETRTFTSENGVGTPVAAWVERDRDEDGYGDSTQDRCPGTASRGDDCPIRVRIAREVKRRAILLEVTAAARATIEVEGDVRGSRAGREFGFDLGGDEKQVKAGRKAVFRVPLPRPLLQQLNRLRGGRSMVASFELLVTDRDGWQSQKRPRVRLWGRR